jgi:ABC-type transport system involved in cytochrome c biogenesis permease subunit
VPLPVVLALASAACFLGLAHAAVTAPLVIFRRCTLAMAVVAVVLVFLSPAAGAALLAPVLFSRRLANASIPATVPELLDRYPS